MWWRDLFLNKMKLMLLERSLGRTGDCCSQNKPAIGTTEYIFVSRKMFLKPTETIGANSALWPQLTPPPPPNHHGHFTREMPTFHVPHWKLWKTDQAPTSSNPVEKGEWRNPGASPCAYLAQEPTWKPTQDGDGDLAGWGTGLPGAKKMSLGYWKWTLEAWWPGSPVAGLLQQEKAMQFTFSTHKEETKATRTASAVPSKTTVLWGPERQPGLKWR